MSSGFFIPRKYFYNAKSPVWDVIFVAIKIM